MLGRKTEARGSSSGTLRTSFRDRPGGEEASGEAADSGDEKGSSLRIHSFRGGPKRGIADSGEDAFDKGLGVCGTGRRRITANASSSWEEIVDRSAGRSVDVP